MTADALRVAWKDVRQHRAWLAAFLAVIVARSVMIASGIDTSARGQTVLASLWFVDLVLSVLQLALLVTLAVQLVQGDRLVGTTAFWLTRPVARGDLLAAKLGTAIGVLVVVPVALDGLVGATYGIGWTNALGAIVEGAVARLAIVVPVMTLAAVTADLAVFVVAAIASVFVTLALEIGVQGLRLVTSRGHDAANSAAAVAVVTLILASGAAFAHQLFTRRTIRSVLLIVVAVALTLYAGARWESDFLTPSRALERGWIDRARVSVTLAPLPADRLQGPLYAQRPWQIPATYAISGSTPNVVLAPVGVRSTAILADGTREELRADRRPDGWDVRSAGSSFVRKDMVEHLLGGVQLLDARDASEKAPTRLIAALADDAYRAYTERGGRFDVDVTVGGLAYEACPALPLVGGAHSRCGDWQISMLSADCDIGKCTVTLRDVRAAFTVDLRRPSRIVYMLVNRVTKQALAIGERNEYGRYPVFPFTGTLLAEHVAVTRRQLAFESPTGMPDVIGPAWARDAVVVPLQVRDIGELTVRAKVVQDGR